MATNPILFVTDEDKCFLKQFSDRINKSNCPTNILLNYPVVYIHYWINKTISYVDKNGNQQQYNKYDVYVGESNDIIERTKQHYDAGNERTNWQYHLVKSNNTPKIIVVGHEHFNKSFTLDVENQLIEYVMSLKTVENLYNGRGNPQKEYYPHHEFDEVFKSIWGELCSKQKDLFLSESEVKDSAIYKASPLKKLTQSQNEAKNQIIRRVYEVIHKGNTEHQLIFIQGEAGTGKTVLNSATFYEMLQRNEDEENPLTCHLMVNHNEQLRVYEQMAKRLRLGDVVSKPTSFIKKNNEVDVAFIDEGHLLLTQGKQSYQGKNQLEDIMKLAKVTVVMFDEYQILTTEQYWEAEQLNSYKNRSKEQNNYIEMTDQLRMKCSSKTKKWIDDFILRKTVSDFQYDSNYEIKSFDSPNELYEAIKEKASKEESRLSRLVATYDWEYSSTNRPDGKEYWEVEIGEWHKPWNYELKQDMDKKGKSKLNGLAWAEQQHTIDEIGSTFTIQGFDLSYVGVILGPSITYNRITGQIEHKPNKSWNKKATRKRTLKNEDKKSFGKILLRNEVKVLMTRGINGLYIYACDKDLRDVLKGKLNSSIRAIAQWESSQVGANNYERYIPLYTIKAACGKFLYNEPEEIKGWIDAEQFNVKSGEDIIAVKAVGNSMENKISDGDYCLFRVGDDASETRGDIVLAEQLGMDEDYGCQYTIKKYTRVKDENNHIQKVVLEPLNKTGYDNIEFSFEENKIVGVYVGKISKDDVAKKILEIQK